MDLSIIQPRKKSNKKSLKHWKPLLKKYFVKKKYYPLFRKHRRLIYNDHSTLKPWEVGWKNDKFDERSELISRIWYIITHKNDNFSNMFLPKLYQQCIQYINIYPKFAKIIFDYKASPSYQSDYREIKRLNKEKGKKSGKNFKRESRQIRNMTLLDLTEGIYASLSN